MVASRVQFLVTIRSVVASMCIFVELLVNHMTVGGHPRACPAQGLQNFHQMMRQKVEHRFVSDTDDLLLDESGA